MKSIGVKPAIAPMPVLMIATYDENNNVDIMNAAWGMQLETNKVVLNLSEGHKTVKNIKLNKAFTVSLADSKHVVQADYVGMVSGNKEPNKLAKSGLSAVKSDLVNAPIITDFPIVMECVLLDLQFDENGAGVVGQVLDVKVKDDVDLNNLDVILFNTFTNKYQKLGEVVGSAFKDGLKLK